MNHRFTNPLAAIALATTVLSPTAAISAAPAELVLAKRALHAAVTHGDEAALLAARNTFAGLAAGDPESNALHYWVAVADWRLVPRLMGTDKAQAEKLCKDGLQHLDAALARDGDFADALALKAGLQGLSLSFNPAAAMTLGGEMEQAFQKAKAVDAKNPRVRFLQALNTLNKPSFVGGGADKALPLFKEAQALFAAETATDSTDIDWGRDDAYVWAGRSAMKLKDYDAARGFYRQALAATPGHVWVESRLLPEAEKAIAEGGTGVKGAKAGKAEGRKKS